MDHELRGSSGWWYIHCTMYCDEPLIKLTANRKVAEEYSEGPRRLVKLNTGQ